MVRKLLTMVAATALAVGSTAAQAAAPLSVARASAPLVGASFLQDDDDDDDGGTAVIIGLVLIVLLAAIVVGGNRGEPSNSP